MLSHIPDPLVYVNYRMLNHKMLVSLHFTKILLLASKILVQVYNFTGKSHVHGPCLRPLSSSILLVLCLCSCSSLYTVFTSCTVSGCVLLPTRTDGRPMVCNSWRCEICIIRSASLCAPGIMWYTVIFALDCITKRLLTV